MDDLTPRQVEILRWLAAHPGAWYAADLVSFLGMRAAGAGVALKGLYRRGLVHRLIPAPNCSAKYRITSNGMALVTPAAES